LVFGLWSLSLSLVFGLWSSGHGLGLGLGFGFGFLCFGLCFGSMFWVFVCLGSLFVLGLLFWVFVCFAFGLWPLVFGVFGLGL
jgi:hypothetical protein